MSTSDSSPGSMMSSREWQFVRVGASVSAIALVVMLGVVPFVQKWRERETQISAERDRYARLQALVAHRSTIDSAATAREAVLIGMSRRVVRARSRALAAASLQSLMQEIAESSNVTVTRLDVAGASLSPAAGGGSTSSSAPGANDAAVAGSEMLPVNMSAVGDIYGLTAFLGALRSGPRVVVVDRLTVQMTSALRGAPDVLQLSMSLHAPAIVE